IQDHADQGVSIDVKAQVGGKDTTLLRFNCFDIEKSYVYGPENDQLAVAGPEMLGGTALTNLYRMDPIACGNPIGWTIRTLGTKLSKMLDRAGYPAVAAMVDYDAVRGKLPQVEACARELYATKRNTVKHNRGTDIFEAGNIRFGLEMRRLPMGDGGLAIHVLADTGKIAEVLPAMKKRALEMWEEGERLTGHPGLPLAPTPNLAALAAE